jgi:hypothetical protein
MAIAIGLGVTMAILALAVWLIPQQSERVK